MWLLGSIRSLTTYLSSATLPVSGEGSGRESLGDRRGVIIEYLGDVCLHTVIRLALTLCVCGGGVSIVIITFTLTFPEHLGWAQGSHYTYM